MAAAAATRRHEHGADRLRGCGSTVPPSACGEQFGRFITGFTREMSNRTVVRSGFHQACAGTGSIRSPASSPFKGTRGPPPLRSSIGSNLLPPATATVFSAPECSKFSTNPRRIAGTSPEWTASHWSRPSGNEDSPQATSMDSHGRRKCSHEGKPSGSARLRVTHRPAGPPGCDSPTAGGRTATSAHCR